MPLCLLDKKPKRVIYQFFIEELIPGLCNIPKILKGFAKDHSWKIPDSLFKVRKSKEFQPVPYIRGFGPWKFFSKDVYHLDNPIDRLELIFLGYLGAPPKDTESKFKPKAQRTLDIYLFPSGNKEKKPKPKPKGLSKRKAPIVPKDRFCAEMPECMWMLRDQQCSDILGIAPVFYLNQELFDLFDDPSLCAEIHWPAGRRYRPSDLVKLSIYQLIEGIDGPTTLYTQLDMLNQDLLKDHLSIPRSHALPGSHRFASDRIQIGLDPIQKFFASTVLVARNLGLIYDELHGEDGQFFETWLKHNLPRRTGLPQFYGGFYNHGGKKKGIGVYQAPIVDINPNGVLPIFSKIVPANRNENVVSWEAVTGAKLANLPPSTYFVADKGLSGVDTQEAVIDSNRIPIIPIRDNIRKGVIITPIKHHHFYQRFVDKIPCELLNSLFDLRTAIERWHNLTDNVFGLARIHACGENHLKAYILLAQTLTVLIAITAFKMGRPDLMSSPISFRSLRESPREMFPVTYAKLNEKCEESQVFCVNLL